MLIGIDGRIFAGKGNGIRRYATSLMKHMLKMDNENEYVIYALRNHDGASYTNFREYEVYSNCQLKIIDLPSILWKSPFFTRILDNDGVDVFHSPAYVLPLVPKTLRRVLLLATFHGLHSEYFLTSYYETIYWIMTYRSSAKVADAIISVSHNLSREICVKYGIPPSKVYVTYSGVSENFKPLKDDERILHCKHLILKYNIPSENYILYPGGGMSPNKNLITILKSWRILKTRYNVKIPLAITRVETLSIHFLLSELNLVGGKDVVGLRWVEEKDLPYLYSCALISVYPSIYEGFGSPIVESMACGTPVITSNASAMPEVAGDAALLVNNPLDPQEWAEKIHTLLNDESLRKELTKRGLLRAKNFTWDKIAERTINTYKVVYQSRAIKR